MKLFGQYRTNLFYGLLKYFYDKINMNREHEVFFFQTLIC